MTWGSALPDDSAFSRKPSLLDYGESSGERWPACDRACKPSRLAWTPAQPCAPCQRSFSGCICYLTIRRSRGSPCWTTESLRESAGRLVTGRASRPCSPGRPLTTQRPAPTLLLRIIVYRNPRGPERRRSQCRAQHGDALVGGEPLLRGWPAIGPVLSQPPPSGVPCAQPAAAFRRASICATSAVTCAFA
jgi:hypothetical protein